MKPIDKRILFRYIIINVALSSVLVLLMWYTGGFIKGILSYIGLVLSTPSFLILALLKGITNAMHFTTYRTFLIVSFLFYSAVITLIQIIILRWKKKRRNIADCTT